MTPRRWRSSATTAGRTTSTAPRTCSGGALRQGDAGRAQGGHRPVGGHPWFGRGEVARRQTVTKRPGDHRRISREVGVLDDEQDQTLLGRTTVDQPVPAAGG